MVENVSVALEVPLSVYKVGYKGYTLHGQVILTCLIEDDVTRNKPR